MFSAKSIVLCVCAVILFTNINAQTVQGIKNPGDDYYKKCHDCAEILKHKPKEIQVGVFRDDLNNAYVYITNKDWFEKFLTKSNDGFAVDVINREQYACGTKHTVSKTLFRGEVQPPVYLKKLKESMVVDIHGGVTMPLGQLPEKFKNKEIELNLITVKNGYMCHYNAFVDVQSYRWQLMDLGFYMDSLTYKTSFDSTSSSREKYILQHKTLKFEIHFEKNKAEYSQEDIKPLYESLRLTDFDIKKINIRAYSSVEGNYEHNIKLQQQRSQSIINALQEFQKDSIVTEISASENWVEFLTDITQTPYANLGNLTKDQIKEKLENSDLKNKLEPILNPHRKAVIILELQKKNKYRDMTSNTLLELYSKSIADKNLNEAIEIQHSIFEKVKNMELPIDEVNKVEIPQQTVFGPLLNNHTMFKYLMDEEAVYETYLELLNLQDLLPEDGHIKYNICVLKFKVWLLGTQIIEAENFKKEILTLEKYGISNDLIKRMLINYNIIMGEYYMSIGDYTQKDKALLFIHNNYKYAPLKDQDFVSLAQYFSSYAKHDWAVRLLEGKVKTLSVSEDMLFYYISLTIFDDKHTRSSGYRAIMLNAINVNKDRFCHLFDTYGTGGVSFQLLDNTYLKKTYCENCNQ